MVIWLFIGIDEFRNIKNASLLYGVVKNLYKIDEEDVREVGKTETYLNVVLMGHCE